MKVVFGHGSFGITLRVEISDEMLATAEAILERFEALALEFDAEFCANLAVQSGPGDYGRDNVWLSIVAGPDVETPPTHEEIISALTGQLKNSIILESGGPEGPNAVSYEDVRDIPNIYVDDLVGGEGVSYVGEFFHPKRDMERWVAYARDISTTDEEYGVIMEAGRTYEAMLALSADEWEKDVKREMES